MATERTSPITPVVAFHVQLDSVRRWTHRLFDTLQRLNRRRRIGQDDAGHAVKGVR
ncbi:hypothetical protein [Bradyrhizobium erythrophlei]|uniref:hypothetical protein n=1 Tax=Bradyrhizobium erythrophlei TaxID=1437360 RepID=UPI0012EC46D5|nr:hypothetical protein [Bradyrhizobium erythrophlei]